MRIVGNDGKLSAPLQGVAADRGRGPGRIARRHAEPRFREDRLVYFSFSEPGDGGAGTAVARGRARRRCARERAGDLAAAAEGRRTESLRLAHRVPRRRHAVHHDWATATAIARKCRTSARPSARSCASMPDGSVPRDNPFVDRAGARPEIWSYRTSQRASRSAASGTRELWTIEHGARGGDELNNPQAGRNYGWPVITYGVDYSGAKIGEGTAKAGMEQPVYYWDPVIAPSGARVLHGPGLRAVARRPVRRLDDAGRPGAAGPGERPRARGNALSRRAATSATSNRGAMGLLYVLTDARRGRVLKLAPKKR